LKKPNRKKNRLKYLKNRSVRFRFHKPKTEKLNLKNQAKPKKTEPNWKSQAKSKKTEPNWKSQAKPKPNPLEIKKTPKNNIIFGI
jgi:hypothetical protein